MMGADHESEVTQGSQAAGQKYRPIKLMPDLSSAGNQISWSSYYFSCSVIKLNFRSLDYNFNVRSILIVAVLNCLARSCLVYCRYSSWVGCALSSTEKAPF